MSGITFCQKPIPSTNTIKDLYDWYTQGSCVVLYDNRKFLKQKYPTAIFHRCASPLESIPVAKEFKSDIRGLSIDIDPSNIPVPSYEFNLIYLNCKHESILLDPEDGYPGMLAGAKCQKCVCDLLNNIKKGTRPANAHVYSFEVPSLWS